jgi:uncharacterized integral membrane protein
MVPTLFSYYGNWGELIGGGLLTGAGGAIAGAITGKRRRLIIAALVGAALGLFVFILIAAILNKFHVEALALGGILGAPLGAILGAILRKLKK